MQNQDRESTHTHVIQIQKSFQGQGRHLVLVFSCLELCTHPPSIFCNIHSCVFAFTWLVCEYIVHFYVLVNLNECIYIVAFDWALLLYSRLYLLQESSTSTTFDPLDFMNHLQSGLFVRLICGLTFSFCFMNIVDFIEREMSKKICKYHIFLCIKYFFKCAL